MMFSLKREGLHSFGWAILLFISFSIVYAVTAQRGVSWQDSGEFQYRILAGDYQWHSGIARAHPLYIVMARGFVALFPQAACFYAMNLFSGVGLALALAVLAYNVMRMTRSIWAAVMAVAVLGFAHMAWWLGTVAEVYTWSLAFLMAELLCLIRYSENRDGRWLIALFGVNGLHWGVHNFALLGLPVYAYLLVCEVWKRRERWAGLLCGCAVFWLIGGGMIVWLSAGLLMETGDPLLVLKSVLFGDGYERQVLGTGGFALNLWGVNMALVGVSLVNPCWVFAERGFFARKGDGQRNLWNGLCALTILHGVFWVRYFVPDQATFVLPTLGLLAVWVGLGVARIPVGRGAYALLLATGIACALTGPKVLCALVEGAEYKVQRSRSLPFRDEIRYWLVPWKQGENSAERFVMEVGKQMKAGNVLIADATAASPLLAAREAGLLSKGWRLVTPWSGEADNEILDMVRDSARKVYVVSPVAGYAPKSLLEAGYVFEPQGVVYRVIGSRQSAVGEQGRK